MTTKVYYYTYRSPKTGWALPSNFLHPCLCEKRPSSGDFFAELNISMRSWIWYLFHVLVIYHENDFKSNFGICLSFSCNRNFSYSWFDLPIRNDAGFRPFTKSIINKFTSKKLNDFILLNNIFHNKKKNAVLTAKSLA